MTRTTLAALAALLLAPHLARPAHASVPAAAKAESPAAVPAAASPEADVVVLRAEQIAPDGRFHWLPRWRAPASPRWALALGGGSAWGLAHIGLLEAAADDGFSPDILTGTSIGAVIGSFVAAGHRPQEIERGFRVSNWNLALSRSTRVAGQSLPQDPLDFATALVDVGRQRSGEPLYWRGIVPDSVITLEIHRVLARPGAIADGDLDRLAVPFRAVSTDLIKGEVFAPRRGTLATLVRASMGIPIFRALPYDGRVLVDGSVLENVPAPTARAMGAEAVIAARLAVGEEVGIDPPRSLGSLPGVLSRSADVTYFAQRKQALGQADVVINIAVGNASETEFHAQLDALVAAGRAAWERGREQAFAALERQSGDRRSFEVARVLTSSPDDGPVALEIARRLRIDGGPRTVSALRLEFELARVLNRDGRPDGHVAVRPDGTALFDLAAPQRVRDLVLDVPEALEPDFRDLARGPQRGGVSPATVLDDIDRRLVDAARRGYFLAGVADVQWDGGTGRLAVRLDPGVLAGLTIRTRGSDRPVPLPHALERSEGRPAEMNGVVSTVVGLYQRGVASDVRDLATRRLPDGAYRIDVLLDEPPMWDAALNAGASDALGPIVWGRLSWPSQAGWKRWGVEVRGVAGRQGAIAGFETSPPGETGRRLFVRATAGRLLLPHYTEGGDLDGSRGFWFQAASAGLRTVPGPLGYAEFALSSHTAAQRGFLEPVLVPSDQPGSEFASDLGAGFAWRGDRRDDPSSPRRGIAWAVEAEVPLVGNARTKVASASFDGHVPLDATGRTSLAFLARGAHSDDDGQLPLARWSDPGSWWEAPRLLPGRGLSPSFVRGTLVARREVLTFSGSTLVVGASAAAWQLWTVRADMTVPRSGNGQSLFVEFRTGRLAPVMVGVTRGSLQGNALFAFIGRSFPWPGPRVELPGR